VTVDQKAKAKRRAVIRRLAKPHSKRARSRRTRRDEPRIARTTNTGDMVEQVAGLAACDVRLTSSYEVIR
jgi:hypothetical protein